MLMRYQKYWGCKSKWVTFTPGNSGNFRDAAVLSLTDIAQGSFTGASRSAQGKDSPAPHHQQLPSALSLLQSHQFWRPYAYQGLFGCFHGPILPEVMPAAATCEPRCAPPAWPDWELSAWGFSSLASSQASARTVINLRGLCY